MGALADDRDRRRGRRRHRRRRVDDPGALGAAQAGQGVPDRQPEPRCPPRSAGGWSTRPCRPEWTVSLGEACEQLGDRFGISRERQDAFALRSHRLADQAWTDGFYKDLVTPVPDTGLERDEGIRPGSTPEKLATLRPSFRPDGTITAGNASPLNDGASAVLLGSAAAARRDRPRPGRPDRRAAGASALEPQSFGYAPVEAANQALARAGIGWSDVGAVELNEAFAVQSLACLDAWPIDPEIVNTRGGAIAIGHPLGASGGRILGTLAAVLRGRRAPLGRRRDLHRRRPGPRRGAGERRMTRGPGRDGPGRGRRRTSRTARPCSSAGSAPAGQPVELIDALRRQRCPRPHRGQQQRRQRRHRAGRAARRRQVRKIICSFPRQTDSWVFDGLYRAGTIELELVPQGNLAERMRAAGAGIGAFFCPTGVGTPLAEGKEQRTIDGRDYVLEYPIQRRLRADQGAPGRRGRQPRLPQDRPQLRPGDGDRGDHDDRPGRRGRRRPARSTRRRS